MLRSRFITRTGLIASLSLMLVACGADTPAPKKDSLTKAPAPQTVTETQTQLTQAAKPKPALADIMPHSPQQIFDLLGEPRLTRSEGKSYIMQYQGENCLLDLVFHTPQKGAALSISHISARSKTGEKLDSQSCFWSLL